MKIEQNQALISALERRDHASSSTDIHWLSIEGNTEQILRS